MSPRPYTSAARQEAAAGTRVRILESARRLLNQSGPVNFTIDAVAAGADVSRMTVYNQFGSKRGLVEALSDDLAERGGIGRLPAAFQAPDARRGLEILVRVFTGLWARERLLIRRLRAVTVLDPELSRANRDDRRRQALEVLLRRLQAQTGAPGQERLEEACDELLVLTSFEAYESFARRGRSEREVAGLVIEAARRLLGEPAA